MYDQRRTAHFFHFIMTMVTGGFWIIPWVLFALYNRSYNDQQRTLFMQQMQTRYPGPPECKQFFLIDRRS